MTSIAAPGFGGSSSVLTDPAGNANAINGPSNFPAINIPQGRRLAKYSSEQVAFYNPSITWAYTTMAGALDKAFLRYGNNTLKVTPSANSAQIRKGSLSMTADPVDQMLTVDVYIPHMVVSGGSGMTISISLFNAIYGAGWSANSVTFSFDSNYLRQGWNSLRMWAGDTNGGSGTGTLAYGAGKTVQGAGCDLTQSMSYFELNVTNMNGLPIYLDGFRRSAKAKTMLVMGFDATGNGSSDDVFTTTLAPFMQSQGYRCYFTNTWVYDMLYQGSADELRKRILYEQYGWDSINHTFNHGGSRPGGTATVTLSRTSNVVTATWGAAHSIPNTSRWNASISGATPSDMNGVFEFEYLSTTTAKFTAAGADGAGTGTITYSTLMQDVVPSASTLSTQIMEHEIIDTANMMRHMGYNRGSTVGAWPNNSVGDISTVIAACVKAGIKLFRAIRGGTCKPSEFGGVDNPYNFGSVEMGSGATATTLQYVKDKLAGAIGRGEHMWTYGHYILDETTAANIAHVNADLNYSPGQNGNPAPPGSAAGGGYWYMGTLKRFIFEAVNVAVAAGTCEVVTPSEFQAALGII